VSGVLKAGMRFAVVWAMQALALLVVTWLVPAVKLTGEGAFGVFAVALSVTLVLALANLLVRPLLVLATLPLSVVTLGFSTFLINALVFFLVGWLLPDFSVGGFGSAVLASLVFAVANTIITAFTTIDDDYSFYGGVVQWLSARNLDMGEHEEGRGLVMLEIDGLSARRLREAVDKGLMPTVAGMLAGGTHTMSTVDCGLPSQTSSCQAGIMYGRNDDIPAFRWYDKERGRVVASSNFRDAAEMNAFLSTGHGLLRDGSSINNHMAGDARKSLFTMSVLTDTPESMQKRSRRDLYLFFLNPYLFPRSIVLSLGDMVLEVFQAVLQRIRRVQPRVNRFHKGYPLIRAATNVFLRDVGTFAVIMDIIRGMPAVYTTYVGYDEVAHHAGPDTWDAMSTLRGLDKQFHRILDVIERKAPRPYELVVLSDHGQSEGATFRQRYCHTLTDLINGLTREEARVVEVNATETGVNHARSLLAEMEGLERGDGGTEGGAAVIARTRRTLEKRMEDGDERQEEAAAQAAVQVLASGNLANVYFDLGQGKVALEQIEGAHAGLLDALVCHPGIGVVLGYANGGHPIAFSAEGRRDLVTGRVEGADPLACYGDPVLRAAQFLHVARFAHAGDLIVNSTLYEDGSVAAFEELVGSHGGLGGEQTEAFLLHPADMEFTPTGNSLEVFPQLNARRGLPGSPLEPHPEPHLPSGWDRESMAAGLRDVHTAAARIWGALRLRRTAFREVAADERASGPALALVLAVAVVSGLVDMFDPDLAGPLGLRFAGGFGMIVAAWLLFACLAHLVGRILRGRGVLSRTLRVMAYALTPFLADPLALIPTVGPFLAAGLMVWVLLAAWVGLQESLEIGWARSILAPVTAVAVVALTAFLVTSMIDGVVITVEQLLARLGWV